MPPPYSQPPPGQHSIAPAQLPREGNIVGIKTAAEIMAQPITGAIRPDQLEPISMPVLLRRIIGRRNVFGTLEILADNFELRIDCEGGTAFLTKSEHSKLIHTFDLDKAEWRLLSTREEDLLRKPFPFARLAIEGLRKLLREQRSEDCKEALGDRLQLAPKVRSDRRRIPKRLGLAGREIRFIENYFDGLQSGHDLADTGPLGASTSYQLLMLLDLYDALEWADVEEPDTAPLADKLVEVADRLEKANYFDVLVVHWSAKDEEFKARYDARKAEFGPGSENDKLNPDACKRIMSRIEVAWLTLKDTVKRTKHRNESFPGQDFQSAADLAHRKRMREKAEAMMKTKK